MFYYVKFECPQAYEGYSEWVLEVTSENEAKEILKEEAIENEKIIEFREYSIEECIAHKEKEIFESIKLEYLNRRYGHLSVREFSKIQKQIERDPEYYYKALIDFDRAQRFSQRLRRHKKVDSITMAEYTYILNKLLDAKTEEEFNSILQSVDKE